MPVVACEKCGAKNRVDERALTLQPVCGRCGANLRAPHEAAEAWPVEVSDDTFAEEVLGRSGIPVLVDCWAPWCPPCRALAPVLDELAAEAGGRYVIAKLDVDENPGIAGQFRVTSIPTLLFFKDGRLVDQAQGALPKSAIRAKLDRLA